MGSNSKDFLGEIKYWLMPSVLSSIILSIVNIIIGNSKTK